MLGLSLFLHILDLKTAIFESEEFAFGFFLFNLEVVDSVAHGVEFVVEVLFEFLGLAERYVTKH